MALPPDQLGPSAGRSVATIDLDRARAYAAATNDGNPRYASGEYAPPVFGVVPTWDVLFGLVTAAVPASYLPMLLHAEHDMLFHQPLRPGMTLVTAGEVHNVRVARSGTWLTVRVASWEADADGGHGRVPVLEQFATMFVRGMGGGAAGVGDCGPDRPSHGFVEGARERPLGEVVLRVDENQTFRYAAASGDTNRIHVDDGFARQAKLPGIILHGLCTMAMCGAALVDLALGGDPSRLARLAVRFSKPVFPGADLVVSLYDGGSGVVSFEASSGGRLVVRDGLAEVREASA